MEKTVLLGPCSRLEAEQGLGSGRWVCRENQDFVPVLNTSESKAPLIVLCGGDLRCYNKRHLG